MIANLVPSMRQKYVNFKALTSVQSVFQAWHVGKNSITIISWARDSPFSPGKAQDLQAVLSWAHQDSICR